MVLGVQVQRFTVAVGGADAGAWWYCSSNIANFTFQRPLEDKHELVKSLSDSTTVHSHHLHYLRGVTMLPTAVGHVWEESRAMIRRARPSLDAKITVG